MLLDRTTEAISHFIGLFQLDIEAARMRDGYDAFRAAQGKAIELNDLPEFTITLRAPYALKGFDPGVDYQPVFDLSAFVTVQIAPYAELTGASVPLDTFVGTSAEEQLMIRIQASSAPHWDIPPPNSIITVTVQHLSLSDNDFLDFGHGYAFVDPSVHAAQFTELVHLAHELSIAGLTEIMTPGYMVSTEEVLVVFDAAMSLNGSAVAGASVIVISGEAASGIVVNGVHVGEMPDFMDNLPAALREDDEEEGADEDGDEDAPDWVDAPQMPGDHDDDAANPYQVAPGHHITMGGNLSANEAFVTSYWVDAGVIAVMGDVVRLDIISQINVMSDQDSGGAGAPSTAVNAAQIENTSSNLDGELVDAGVPTFPQHWQVERVEGDVVALNWVQQHIFATDFDRAEIEISGSNTAIGLGGNTLGNFMSILELGFHYDLIIVGGAMITLNMIAQINVLLDADAIAGTAGAVNVIDTGDNYLQNSASISSTGIDTMEEMTDDFAANGEALANGAGSITGAIAADPLFAGYETLSVLYISGDLIQLNAIQQYNYVGDADQVYLALDDFIAAAGDDVTVTTGSNALLNDAQIANNGIDSVVMAGGDVYSDALIHQAGLIDPEAMPNGVTAALSNEAIAAFLTGDMIEAAPIADDFAGAAPMPADSGSLDVMNSVLV